MTQDSGSWTSSLVKAVWTLVVVTLALLIVEPIFMRLLPGLLVALLLIGVYRVALGAFRSGGW